jgi:hypothetical protein
MSWMTVCGGAVSASSSSWLKIRRAAVETRWRSCNAADRCKSKAQADFWNPTGRASAAGFWGDEPQLPQTRGQQTAQGAEAGAVDPRQRRVWIGSAHHGDLVTEE